MSELPKWSDVLPTTEGYYWWRKHAKDTPMIKIVVRFGDRMAAVHQPPFTQYLEEINGQWQPVIGPGP